MDTAKNRWKGFSVMKNRNLFLFISGRLVSLIGSGIQMIALPLFILDKTGSGTLMGVFTMLSMVPALLAAPIAGVLGDRLNRKSIAVYTDCGRGLLILFLAWLAFAGRLSIAAVFACQIFVSILDSLFQAATAAMLPDLVDSADYGKANAARSGVDSLCMIIGPILGGVIYGVWGIQVVFLLNAVSFIVSAACEWLIVYKPTVNNETKLTVKSSLREIGETLGFIGQKAGLKQLFLFAMFTNFLASPIFMVGLPFVLKKVIGFSSSQYGYLMTAFTVGALLSNIILGTLLAKASAGRLMRMGLFAQGILLIGLMFEFFPAVVAYFRGATWTLFAVIAGGFVVAGFFNAFVNTPLQTNLQKMVPAGMRARFFAVLGLIAQLAVPVGSVVYGFALDHLPAHLLLMGVGILIFAVTMIFLKIAPSQSFEPDVEEEPGMGTAPAVQA